MTDQPTSPPSRITWSDCIPQLQAGRARDRQDAVLRLRYEANMPEAIAAVLPLLRTMAQTDRSARVRATAGDTLAFMEKLTPDPLVYWTAQLQSPHCDDRYEALWRLGRIGDPSAIALVQKAAATDRSKAVRRNAHFVLREWGIAAPPETSPTPYERIIKRLTDPTSATMIGGFRVHRQNNRPLRSDEIELLAAAFQEVEKVGGDLAPLAQASELQIVYTADKRPFGLLPGRQGWGAYDPFRNLAFVGLGELGAYSKRQVPVLAHELFGHWLLSYHRKWRHREELPGTLLDLIHRYEQSMQYPSYLDYEDRTPTEIWACMVEQCIYVLLDYPPIIVCPDGYDGVAGYWNPSEWGSLLHEVPAVLCQQIQDMGQRYQVTVEKRGLLWQI